MIQHVVVVGISPSLMLPPWLPPWTNLCGERWNCLRKEGGERLRKGTVQVGSIFPFQLRWQIQDTLQVEIIQQQTMFFFPMLGFLECSWVRYCWTWELNEIEKSSSHSWKCLHKPTNIFRASSSNLLIEGLFHLRNWETWTNCQVEMRAALYATESHLHPEIACLEFTCKILSSIYILQYFPMITPEIRSLTIHNLAVSCLLMFAKKTASPSDLVEYRRGQRKRTGMASLGLWIWRIADCIDLGVTRSYYEIKN